MFLVLTETVICKTICLKRVAIKFLRSHFSTSGTGSITSHKSDSRNVLERLYAMTLVFRELICHRMDNIDYVGCQCGISEAKKG